MLRRAFFGEAAAAAFCVSAGVTRMLTRHIASGATQGKPPLTVRSINQYIEAAQREDESTQLLLAAEAKRDMLTFLDQRFALSKAQRRGLSTLTDEDRRRIKAGIESALRPGWKLVFRSSASTDGATDKSSVIVTTTSNSDSLHGQPNGTVVLSWPCPATQ